MPEIKNRLAGMLEKIGTGVFGFLSRWEERGVMPRTARWLKLGTLGALVIIVGALTAQATPQVNCYIAVHIPDINITDVLVSPNPTAGADSVKVKATAKVFDPTLKNNYISGAWLLLENDTTRVPLKALDGRFSDTLEVLEGHLYVGDLDTGSSWVTLVVTTSEGAIESYWTPFVVTDSMPQDSTNSEE